MNREDAHAYIAVGLIVGDVAAIVVFALVGWWVPMWICLGLFLAAYMIMVFTEET